MAWGNLEKNYHIFSIFLFINLPMLIIAEIGLTHDGSLGMAHAFIDALALTGVDAIKFQTHIPEAESSPYEPFRVPFSYQDKNRMDYWQRTAFTSDQWAGLKSHCDEKGVEFMSSPFSNAAVDLLENIGVKRYKVGSGEVNNMLLLEKIARTGKPVILSSGMSSFAELDRSVEFLRSRNVEFSIMQCSTAYPTKPAQWGLNVIGELKARYGVPVGFSDHSGVPESALAAVALGAELLEFHVTFHKQMFGPDVPASLTIEETAYTVKAVRNILEALDNPVDKTDNSAFKDVKQIFEKSLAVNKDLPAGHVLRFEDLEAKKPKGYGIPASAFQKVTGRKLSKPKNQWDFLKEDDLI